MRAIAVAAVLLCGCPTAEPVPPLDRAEKAFQGGRFSEAEGLAQGVLKTEPSARAVSVAVESALAAGSPNRALRTFDAHPADLPARLHVRLAPYLVEAGRLSEAVAAYRRGVEGDPENLDAREELAKLLGIVGLRDEAVPHVLAVAAVRETDLLMLTAVESGLIREPALLRRAEAATAEDPLPLHGLANLASADGDAAEAERLFSAALKASPAFPPSFGRRGRLLAEKGDLPGLARWAASIQDPDRLTADGWLAVGRLAEAKGDWNAAAEAYRRAAVLRPESREATARLAAALRATGRADDAADVAAAVPRMQRLRDVQSRVLFGGGEPGPEDLVELVDAYAAAGREAEAAAWGRVAVEIGAADANLIRRLAALHTGGDRLVADDRRPAGGVKPDPAAVAELLSNPDAAAERQTGNDAEAVRLRDIAGDVGVAFRYDNAAGDPPALKMYEFGGGGVAAFDFDGDARCDLFFTQAGGPPNGPAADGDRLLRNRGVATDVTDDAFLSEAGYGQGIAAGDLDADGFPDVYVANVGDNVLWRNLGDGTFETIPLQTPGVWTASCLMADLTGDGVCDLLDVNYLRGQDVLSRVCRAEDGRPAMCMPYDFEAEADVLHVGDGTGGFVPSSNPLDVAEPGKGLGVLAYREPAADRLSVFIANDLTPNHLLVPAGDGRLRDEAVVRGVALNGGGKAEGCMGVAAADVNGDGRLDLHVTNFLAESNTLFVSAAGDSYADRTAETGLEDPTLGLLGFGTCFFDADADGRQELFVANGHLQDLSRFGRPYAMPPQLFAAAGGRLVDVSADAGPFFGVNAIGRSAATLDWDGDGAEETVVTHLNRPAALLSADAGRSVRLDFVGVESPRPGLGVIATGTSGERTEVRAITAGGGYMAEGEHAMTFGLGRSAALDRLVIRWSSGREQTFEDVAAGRWRLIEGGTLRALPGE